MWEPKHRLANRLKVTQGYSILTSVPGSSWPVFIFIVNGVTLQKQIIVSSQKQN